MKFHSQKRLVNLLAVIEAASVTGPAKNLLAFCRDARTHQLSNLPLLETSLATFVRQASSSARNDLIAEAVHQNTNIDTIEERFRFDPRVVEALRKIAEREAIDVVQTHNVKSHCLIRMSGLWRHHKWVAFHHGYATTDLKMQAYNQLDRWSLRAAHPVVTMNRVFAEQLEGLGVPRARIRILHNAIDGRGYESVETEAVRALRSRFDIKVGEHVVLTVGRLSKEKGHADLLKAFVRLAQLHPALPCKLLLVGDGPERRRIEQGAVAAGVREKVIFAGQVENVKPYFAAADIMVLPSHSEGSPNVLLEAMAARVPTVATSVGGVPEIATHQETALLVKARDLEAMTRAMAELLCNAERAEELASNARAHVTNHLSPDVRLRSLLNIYSELMPTAAYAEIQSV